MNTQTRLNVLKTLNALNYYVQQDMDGTAYVTLGEDDTEDSIQEYDNLPDNIKNLVDVYFDDATIT